MERVRETLNRALGNTLRRDARAYLIGEDIVDPYGGAFKVTAGLSARFPGRVLSTPISESAIVGLGAGLALAGDTAIVEIMFADFVALAFDPLLNFASKAVTRRASPPMSESGGKLRRCLVSSSFSAAPFSVVWRA